MSSSEGTGTLHEIEIPVAITSPGQCTACVLRLTQSVAALKGVSSVEIDPTGSRLHATIDETQITQADLQRAVEIAGFEVAESVGHAAWRVQGLDCPDCARTVAISMEHIDGVLSADLNFASALLSVEFDREVDPRTQIDTALSQMGYSATTDTGYGAKERDSDAESTAERGWRAHKHDVAMGLSGAAIVIGVAADLLGTPALVGTLFYALAVVSGGLLIFRRAWVSLKSRVLDMNVLMTVAVLGAAAIGEWREAAMVVFLFSIGGFLESRSLARTRSSIRDLMDLAPERARVRRDGADIEIAPADVVVGETLIVRPGERIALDGRVVRGISAVDESPITGESVPVDKWESDEVFAGSLNTTGVLEVTVTSLAADTTLSRIIYLVEEAQSQRAPSQQLVDRFTRYYTPIVVLLAVFVALVPPVVGTLTGLDTGGFSEWFYRALVLLVVSCPCALVISTPVAIVSAITRATRDGVLVKGGSFLEIAPKVRAVAFDKTGTLTEGRPEVAEIEAFDGGTAQELLVRAAALEANSNHPLARAVVRVVGDAALPGVAEISELPGLGMTGTVGGEHWSIGSVRMARDSGVMDSHAEETVSRMEDDGRTVLLVWKGAGAESGALVGALGISDTVRDEASEAIATLLEGSISETVMLTGDNERTAAAVAASAGVSQYRARLLPHEKVGAIEELKAEYGVVAMVGDGINDAPALAASDIGIAMGAAGSDTAIETADVALMSDDLSALPRFFDLGRRTVANIKQNVIFSVAIKFVVLIAAIAGYAPLWLAVFADTGVALLVILNGLRLLRPTPGSR